MITIRPAARGDIGLILSLIRELAAYEKEPEAAVATVEQVERALFGEIAGRGPLAECFIGEVNGVAEGFALFFMNYSTWTGKPGLYLEDLFVRPSARGVGLGKALFVHLAKIAVERGCGRYEWSVLDWNTPALEFYRAMGATAMDGWTVHRLSGEALEKLAAR
ncbi:MAG TPA: GNAT family N-acetyltransferase [Phycisphaerales bacterium]|nr:GNAT family N-acetyltransferase [Phycisphaerales bacterium]